MLSSNNKHVYHFLSEHREVFIFVATTQTLSRQLWQ